MKKLEDTLENTLKNTGYKLDKTHNKEYTIEEIEDIYTELDQKEILKEQDMILIPQINNETNTIKYKIFLKSDNSKKLDIFKYVSDYSINSIDAEVKKNNNCCVSPENKYVMGFTQMVYHLIK